METWPQSGSLRWCLTLECQLTECRKVQVLNALQPSDFIFCNLLNQSNQNTTSEQHADSGWHFLAPLFAATSFIRSSEASPHVVQSTKRLLSTHCDTFLFSCQSQKQNIDLTRQAKFASTPAFALFVTLKNVVCKIGEDAEVLMSLYDPMESKFIR